MQTTQHLVFFVFKGCQLLDYSGVAAVFEMANRCSEQRLYSTSVVCASGNAVTASNGLTFMASDGSDFINQIQQTFANNASPIDIVFLVGGDEYDLTLAVNDPVSQRIVKRLCELSKRKCSVCSGTFFLAMAQELEYKKATTHWSGIEKLVSSFPNINVQDNVLYTIDGDTMTSAGVSTGIDLALEIVALDHGLSLSNAIAKRLVVSNHRPGNSSQLHAHLLQQNNKHQQFHELCLWLKNNLEKNINVDTMASRVSMSPRHFSRRFKDIMGLSPQQYFTLLKIEHAKGLLERGYTKYQICKAIGYKNTQSFSRIFEHYVGVSLSQYEVREVLLLGWDLTNSLS